MTCTNAQNACKGRSEVVVLYIELGALLLDLVRAAEHAVNGCEVVSAREDGLGASLGGVVLLQVSLLTEVAHLQNLSAT